mmetsp:Transcript_44513/g.81309  ORF Transcript_44513/g.81309 Transcript_44513/m.81309 type:complete len:175 (+) Transcript_44513:30-554(+)
MKLDSEAAKNQTPSDGSRAVSERRWCVITEAGKPTSYVGCHSTHQEDFTRPRTPRQEMSAGRSSWHYNRMKPLGTRVQQLDVRSTSFTCSRLPHLMQVDRPSDSTLKATLKSLMPDFQEEARGGARHDSRLESPRVAIKHGKTESRPRGLSVCGDPEPVDVFGFKVKKCVPRLY